MLANGTEGFPLVGMVEPADEPIDCTEDSTTLKALLRLLHSSDSPMSAILGDLTPSELIEVGHAANKYGARAIADSFVDVIRSKAKEIPWLVLRYGLRYGDATTMDVAAPHTLANGSYDIQALENAAARAWYVYREYYFTLVSAILTTPPVYINKKRKEHNCGGWGTYVDDTVGHVSSMSLYAIVSDVAVNGPHTLFSLSYWANHPPVNPGYGGTCRTCNNRAKAWQRKVKNAVSGGGWRSFSQILQGLPM